MKKLISIILISILGLFLTASPDDADLKSKIDPRIVSYFANKGKLPKGMHFAKKLEGKDGKIEVEIVRSGVINTGSTTAMGGGTSFEAQLRNFDVEIMKVRKNLVEGRIKEKSLMQLAADPGVKEIRLPLYAHPHSMRTEGVNRSGATAWQPLAPYRGSKVKICILDGGFKGYKDLLGKTLPSDVITKSFTSDEDLEGISVHGAACAEIVHAMAPEAQIYLVNHGSYNYFVDAIDWIIEQKIDIVSYSMGWYNTGPGNGKDIIIKEVDRAVASGVTFISSAGNSGYSHWRGDFKDADNDGFHDFEDGSNMMTFDVPAGLPVELYLRWNDWGTYNPQTADYSGTAEDYDMFLYAYFNGGWQPVTPTNRVQDGDDWPVESGGGVYLNIAAKWGIKIQKKSSTKTVTFDLFAPNQFFPNFVADGSLTSPADGESVYTVGAVDWVDDSFHIYSSQGPTLDGRIKPDVTSYARVSTESYGEKAFYGTSASCPHVAGAIALIMSKTPYSGADAIKIFNGRALDKGDEGKDNKYGYGILKLTK